MLQTVWSHEKTITEHEFLFCVNAKFTYFHGILLLQSCIVSGTGAIMEPDCAPLYLPSLEKDTDCCILLKIYLLYSYLFTCCAENMESREPTAPSLLPLLWPFLCDQLLLQPDNSDLSWWCCALPSLSLSDCLSVSLSLSVPQCQQASFKKVHAALTDSGDCVRAPEHSIWSGLDKLTHCVETFFKKSKSEPHPSWTHPRVHEGWFIGWCPAAWSKNLFIL